jgi:hypothetical protein
MTDVSRMRVSDADREAVVGQLQQAAVEGRLSLDELGERVSEAYAAVTWAELVQVVDDLPGPVYEEPGPVEDLPNPGLSRVLSLTVLALGAAAVPVTFSSPWAGVLGGLALVLGAFALGVGDNSRFDRNAVIGGMMLGVIPIGFFGFLLLLFST